MHVKTAIEIENLIEEWHAAIDQRLDQLIAPCEETPYSPLFAAARYSLLSPGKRLRPLLLLATVFSYETPLERAWSPACALEMIHTYSLIHDDLPCMDDDDLRRGRPTLHKVYPEWQALLAGDYLLTYAFEVLAQSCDLSPEQRVALVREYALCAGGHGMIGGQTIDLLFQNREIPYALLEEMHKRKTAALISLALTSGAIIAKAKESEVATLREIGYRMGIAFQLVDDILDQEGHIEISRAKTEAARFLNDAERTLHTLSRPFPVLNALFKKMIDRRK